MIPRLPWRSEYSSSRCRTDERPFHVWPLVAALASLSHIGAQALEPYALSSYADSWLVAFADEGGSPLLPLARSEELDGTSAASEGSRCLLRHKSSKTHMAHTVSNWQRTT